MAFVAPSEDDDVLSPDAWSRVLSAWAVQVGIDESALHSAGVHAIQRDDLPALVVVKLRASAVVVGPFTALTAISGLGAQQLLSIDTLAERLVALAPEPIGAATLAYRDGGFGAANEVEAERADADALTALRAAVTDEEWEEGGLGDMADLWVVRNDAGDVAAIAGFGRWGKGLAHVGVVASGALRRHGFARRAAVAAIGVAHHEGLVAQWRCRKGNVPSARLGASLGFVVLGEQTAVALNNYAE